MSESDNKQVIIDFSKQFDIADLGSISISSLETIFEEDDFLAYAAAAAKN